MKHGYAIKLNHPISERLLYTTKNYLMKAISLANPDMQEVNIFADKISILDYKGKEVGIGYSAGVDSFSTISKHISDNCIDNYKITYFIFLNVGSHGDFGGCGARELFNKRYEQIKEYGEEVKIKIIKIDSNISEVLELEFQPTCTFRSTSAILLLQKLFSKYYFHHLFEWTTLL